MNDRQINSSHEPHLGTRRRGFSFTEILFAVMILGIGFIMVAALFPVAIHQTEATNEETIAASIGRAGTGFMSQVASAQWPPVTTSGVATTSLLIPTLGTTPVLSSYKIPLNQSTLLIPGELWSMYDFRDLISSSSWPLAHKAVLWQAVANNLIQAGDPRFGWVAFYRRDMIAQGQPGQSPYTIVGAPYAQVTLVAVQSRNKQQYSAPTDIQYPPLTTTLFLPQYLSGVQLQPPTAANGELSTVTFNSTQTTYGAVAENAYLLISYDYGTTGTYTGRVYRIGVYRQDLSNGTNAVWTLAPGEDLSPTDSPPSIVDVYVVGRAPDPTHPGQYAGPAQDVSVYTTYVPTK